MAKEVIVSTATDIKVSQYVYGSIKFVRENKSAFVSVSWNRKGNPQFQIIYYDTEYEKIAKCRCACQAASHCGTTNGAEALLKKFFNIK